MGNSTAELIARLEDAEVGRRELDLRVFERFDLVDGERWTDADLKYALTDPDRTINPPRLTTSLDAALALAERVLPLGSWRIEREGAVFWAKIWSALPSRSYHKYADAKTPALALCIAILRALDQGEERKAD